MCPIYLKFIPDGIVFDIKNRHHHLLDIALHTLSKEIHNDFGVVIASLRTQQKIFGLCNEIISD